MSDHAPFADRHYFLLRRLHSLSGVFPIGAFLFPHLVTNSSIVWGRWLNDSEFEAASGAAHAGVETFQHEVDFIHGLPWLVIIEAAGLWLPIAFHSLLGLYFARTGRSNVGHYAYQDNWRYTWQRITGYIGIVYIAMHVTSLRFGWTFGGLMPAFEVDRAASSTAEHFQGGTLGVVFAVAFYAIGMLALVFHFANGLWTAAITWGLTVSERAQARWGYVCAAVGLLLAAAGIAAIAGFAMLDIPQARTIEDAMLAVR